MSFLQQLDPKLEKLARLTTPAWEQFKYHEKQHRLWTSNARFKVVCAGRGSGKTAIARMFTTRWLPVRKPWRDPVYCFCLPTYAQAERVGWKKIRPLIPEEWIVSDNKSELCITTIFGSTLYVVGMDKPQRIEGMQIDGAVLDECSDQKPEAFTRTILPMLTHRRGWCWRIGVPKRNGCGAKEFKAAYVKGLVPGNAAQLESYSWPSSDVLTPDQLMLEKAQMSEKDAEEQFGGVWVDAEGQIYFAFSETQNVSTDCVYDFNKRIGVGSDFNVDPMSWVLFHYENGVFRVFDELYLHNVSTQHALDELYRRYPTHKAGWNFYGDASSKARHTATTDTDYLLILNDGRFINKVVNYGDSNPPVLDRFAAVNAICCNALKIRRLFIHPKCENLIADLTGCSYKPNTRQFDDTDKTMGHITDALGYPIVNLQPIELQYLNSSVYTSA